MTTSRRGLLFHFTHVDNLVSIVQNGLNSDTQVRAEKRLETDIGQPSIKDRRRRRPVPVGSGGVVADYVPFYFAARSPMLGALYKGKVESFTGSQDQIVYLMSKVDRLVDRGIDLVFTDRNAALDHAEFSTDPNQLDEFVDWPLMEGRMWSRTPDEPDRMERRMAECLVYRHLPWDALLGVATQTDAQRRHVEDLLSRVGTPTTVLAKPGWYFP
jgi:hypothetical protein